MTLKGTFEGWENILTISSFDTGSPPEDRLSDGIEMIDNNNVISHASSITTPISLLVQSLVKQLCMMLEKDPRKASNLYNVICEKLHQMQLLDETYAKGEFEEMRQQYQLALHQLVKVTNEAPFVSGEIPLQHPTFWPVRPTEPSWSRYFRDFEELSFVARGGFGSVFKARNRLDGMEYAIKKVSLRARDINSVSKHFDEVKTFASLSHPNIVSYKAAWLEPLVNYKTAEDAETAAATTENPQKSTNNFSEDADYLSKNDSDDFEVLFEGSESKETSAPTLESRQCKALCKLRNNDTMRYFESAHVDLQWATLYIQMAFCERTLKTWIEDRNSKLSNSVACRYDSPHVVTAVNLLTQLAKGLNYIHGLKIVHHDIKPTNVFVREESGNVFVQIADFGLACPSQTASHVPAQGTCLYAAPEQIRGKCHSKNDLYSIGLIFLELIESFKTTMEKTVTFNLVREGHVPVHVTGNCPKLAQIISKLAEKNIEKRLDGDQLLHMLRSLKESREETIKILKDEISAKDELIQSKDDEIIRLKRLLQINNIKL